eukprot:39620-Pyramimonas_sp.AAC.1
MPGVPPCVSRARARDDAWAECASWGAKPKGGGPRGNKGCDAAKGSGKGAGCKGADNLVFWERGHCQCGKNLHSY